MKHFLVPTVRRLLAGAGLVALLACLVSGGFDVSRVAASVPGGEFDRAPTVAPASAVGDLTQPASAPASPNLTCPPPTSGGCYAQAVVNQYSGSKVVIATYNSQYLDAIECAVQALDNTNYSGDHLVRLSGTCYAQAQYNGLELGSGAATTLEGGWNSSFTTLDPNSRATIDGNNRDNRPLKSSRSLTMKYMRVTNGHEGGYNGGGIYTTAPLTMVDSTIYGNRTAGNGGGIYAEGYGCSINLTRVSITSNSTERVGGAIYAIGAVTLNLDRVVVDGNGTPYANVSDDGGGIYLGSDPSHGGEPVATITNSTISNSRGSGIKVTYGRADIRYTTITGNKARTGPGINATTLVTVTNSIVARNKVSDTTYGGDVYGGGLRSGGGNVIGAGDTAAFAADFDQVGISDPGLGSPVNGVYPLLATSPAIEAATCSVDGVAITTDGSSQPRPGGTSDFCDAGAYETQGKTAACIAKTGDTSWKSATNRALQQAVNAAADAATVKVAGTCAGTFITHGDRRALQIGRNVTVEGGYSPTAPAAEWEYPNPTKNHTVVDAKGAGGVLRIGYAGTVSNFAATVRNLTLTGGSLPHSPGVLINEGVQAAIDSCSITGNHATDAAGRGGGVTNASASLTLTGSLIQGNTAIQGGGLLSYKSGAATPVLTVLNNTFTGNQATDGGGLMISAGNAEVGYNTFVANSASGSGASLFAQGGGTAHMSANIFADAQGVPHCAANGATLTSGGYNRVSDGSCAASPANPNDLANATVDLLPLAYNGGATQNFMPAAAAINPVLDVVPLPDCEAVLSTSPVDQRNRVRPRIALPGNERLCDVGSIERGGETLTVCGPPLDLSEAGNPLGRCQFVSVGEALAGAASGDTIVVSGVLTESVTVDKDLTLRGPTTAEATPGTQMGFLQGAATKPGSGCTTGLSVVRVASGAAVTIEDMNIRYGCAADGAGISNAGTLTLRRSTVYENFATGNGGGLYNGGTATIEDCTFSGNGTSGAGGAVYDATGASLATYRSTFTGNTAAAGPATVYTAGTPTIGGSILVAAGSGDQCSAAVSPEQSIVSGLPCGARTTVDPDPGLGLLRDNGGPTLTHAIRAGSSAVDAGYISSSPYCAGQTDQRGRARPQLIPYPCDAGAYEYGPRILAVDPAADTDVAALQFKRLQDALDRTLSDDIVELVPGEYTGNFTVYRDMTLRHKGLSASDVGKLSPEMGYDLRALVQASKLSVGEQKRLGVFAGTVLTIQGYGPTGASFVPNGSINVTLEGLTIRHGTGSQGGGIFNLAGLTLRRCTLEGNAAVDAGALIGLGGAVYNLGALSLDRTTLSGNRAEHAGGALYSAGSPTAPATMFVSASTLAENLAGPVPAQWVVAVTSGGLADQELTTASGDEVRFDDQTGQQHVMQVQTPPAGVACSPMTLTVPRVGTGTSDPIICTTDGTVTGPRDVQVRDRDYGYVLTLHITPPSYEPAGASIFQEGNSETRLDRSIVYTSGNIAACSRPSGAAAAQFFSNGNNVLSPEGSGGSTCSYSRTDRFADPLLGPLQDNNIIAFDAGRVSGFTFTRALDPRSPAIDAVTDAACAANTVYSLDPSSPRDLVVQAGDVVAWSGPAKKTVVFDDGQASEWLVEAPEGGSAVEKQFDLAGSFTYRVYDPVTRQSTGAGVITVTAREQRTDQRGLALPAAGSAKGLHRCDIGAYEFQPWVVGENLPRPPSASGQAVPAWSLGAGDVSKYDLWSPADFKDYPLRPTRSGEVATVTWQTNPSDAAAPQVVQSGIVLWPQAPQLHVSGAPVNLNHSGITDGFAVATSSVVAYDGVEPMAITVLSTNVFSRTITADLKGEAYTVLPLTKGTQSSGLAIVDVVRTLDWNTAGLRDLRDRNAADGYTDTDCVIGQELTYRGYDDGLGLLPGHGDAEGRPGWIISGTAFDGALRRIDLATTVNTVGDALPPAHVRELRDGPIIPVLAQAPTTAYINADPATGGDDLRVAWYRPDTRNVAWPLKTVGYRCKWPADANAPKIVIASELGSELGDQPQFQPAAYANPAVYNQTDPSKPGYSPNYEHALLAASSLGNAYPALFALRTDLFQRDTVRNENLSYALVKYRDPTRDNRLQMLTYRVVLTQPASEITAFTTDPGEVTLAATQTAPTSETGDATAQAATLVLHVADGVLANGGAVRLPVDAQYAVGLRTSTLRLSYDPALVTPSHCVPNDSRVVEEPFGATVQADQGVLAQKVVHLRARVEAGTDLRYLWDFGDGSRPQYDERTVSHVYAAGGTYTAQVQVSNGLFETPVSATVAVQVRSEPGEIILLEPEAGNDGCRIEDGKIVLSLRSRNKHGNSGEFKLADVAFTPVTPFQGGATTEVAVASASLWGPDYSDLTYSLTAGSPVYALAPMRGLLDVQPCSQTQAADVNGEKPLPFWKDWKGMLWARAAGDMDVLYYYPLQEGFYVSADYAASHGLPAGEADRAGKCVPWLDEQPGAISSPGSTDRVYPVSYRVRWPDSPGLLNVGETIFQRAKGGVSAVASQAAVARIYDDLAPGAWDNNAQAISLQGPEVLDYVTQLIDPLAEVKVELKVQSAGTPALPAVIKAERLLYGAGLAIIGSTRGPDYSLPFALRSRVLYQDAPQDLDGDDEANGVLIFRGYYDGASPEYIKGDPLLLLNVMSLSDKYRLQSLCADGSVDCATFNQAVEDLYWETLNPRGLDLCRDSAGRLSPTDTEPADNQGPKDALLSQKCTAGYYRDGLPDHAFLIGLQDSLALDLLPKNQPDGVLDTPDGIPEPYQGVGKGKALTAGNAAGLGYVTLAYNNDASLGSLPVSLQVVKVKCAKNQDGEESPYRGNLLVIKSDNLFDEKLTLRHTGDFGGRPDNYSFEWWIAPVDDSAVSPEAIPNDYPWQRWTRLEPGLKDLPEKYQVLGPEITIEGANPTTLRDNWVLVRYKNKRCPLCGNMYTWSAFAGDPSAKPSQVLGQLAEGWIKRVVNALNPFDTRVDDFVSSSVSASVDMIRQAGPRYEGPVAMNADPENLNKMGLIEAYQTVLERGRALSIDAGVNDQGANAALLNVTSRISQLYMLLGNDAYLDALDPIVGFDDSTLGLRASAVFAFANQFRPDLFGPIDEELALLRGRDETLGGVAAAPTYNRLTWNFTNGEGEVAYVMNYNIDDINLDGFINEADAQIMYPQGHGDAYGQQLTALTLYYQLLKHPDYTWVPRGEPVSVAGAPVVVDYYDERRFAAAAAARARMGAEVVNLTYRKNYAEPDVQAYWDNHVDSSDTCDTTAAPGCDKRAWGVADWAGRTGEGAYFDWLVSNAILPPVDTRYGDLRKIDRTTVEDIATVADELTAVQTQLDRADQGVNPLGLANDAVLFDLDPALTKTTPGSGEGQEGETHFEQVYDKTLKTVGNTLKMFAFANQAKAAERAEQDQQHEFAADMLAEDRGAVNDLIETFGYPYDKDIGVNGTYPEGYDGPDIYNYDLIERTDLTNAASRCDDNLPEADCRAETSALLVEFPRMPCLGFYVDALTAGDKTPEQVCKTGALGAPQTLAVTYTVGIGLDEGRGRYLPESWGDGAKRKAWGTIQSKLWTVYDTRVAYEQAIAAYDNKIEEIDEASQALLDRYETLRRERKLKKDYETTVTGLKSALLAVNEIKSVSDSLYSLTNDALDPLATACVPRIFGFANDTPLQCPIQQALSVIKVIEQAISLSADMIGQGLDFGAEIAELKVDLDLFDEESDWELRQMGRDLQGLIRDERELRLAMFLAADNFGGAQLDYDATVQEGFRKVRELVRLRQRWAGQITGGRYSDMAYRLAENDALQKYRQQFDLAQLYTYLAATAYDYETNLRGEDTAAGDKLIRRIVAERSLGELRWNTGAWDLDPIVGSGGLADVLGRLRDNFLVLKGQMGFNNPQAEVNRFSLRSELFRLRDSSNAEWRETLQEYYTPNIFANPTVAKLAKRPYGESGPEPGLVIPFGTTITRRLNFFGNPLGPGDSSYSATQFATKIASAGVWFEGYDDTRLAATPRVYLLPGGDDVLRPRNTDGKLRYWNVTEQLLPLPYPITESDMQNPAWLPGVDGLEGRLYQIKPYADMRAYVYAPDFSVDQMNTDTRLIGRSVWNTQWVLVIPGATLLADPQVGMDRFIQDVDDIYVYFQTYAYVGASMASTDATSAERAADVAANIASGGAVAGPDAASPDVAAPKPMPQPDAIFYGLVERDGTPLESGILTAILPRAGSGSGTITAAIAPVAGTNYNYALTVPLGYYDPGESNYASDSLRLGETVRFTVDGVPALLKTTAGATYNEYRVDFAGAGYTVTVDTSGPGAYPLGDVNVSGKRDSADALLVLKYDVGLAQGVTTWPPGPATVYLPLCDITQDGACNSTDALRILMCDVGLASCPGDGTTPASVSAAADVLAGADPVTFKLSQSVDAATQEVVVQVEAAAPATPLGAVSLDLRYDPAKFVVASCAENPDGWLDLAVCNPGFSASAVRYTGITTGGIREVSRLLELRLKVSDPTVFDRVTQGTGGVTVENLAAYDLGGSSLQPVVSAPGSAGPNPNRLLLPLIYAPEGTQ